jgi:hypothetical protein
MSTTLSNRYLVDLPEWRALSNPSFNQSTTVIATAGTCMGPDMRARNYADPNVFFNSSSNIISSYNYKLDAWNYILATGLGGTFGQGAMTIFCPSWGPSGTIAAGATTSSVTLTTALPNSVNANWLNNRGDGLGFIVRIIGNTAGSSGKIEERRIIANTSGTTPTIYFDKPLSFIPATGDRYEFLSGSVVFLNTGASATANIFRRYDVLSKTMITTSMSTTALIATIPSTHNQLIALDEQYVPHDRNPGEGQIVGASTYDTAGDFTKKCLLATATAATSITGQASNGDATVVANQFRNYQIRIVEDITNPLAVGQRRRITSHTAGASPVYSVATWTSTPSANCRFVIENDTDKIIGFFGSPTTATYNYNISTNTWDTSTWGPRGTAMNAGGLTCHAFGVSPSPISGNALKPSNIISFRGGNTNYDVFDISGSTTGTWTNNLGMAFVGNSGMDALVGAGDYLHFAYNPHTQEGKYMYFALGTNINYSTQRMYVRFDSSNGIMSKVAGPKLLQGSSNTTGVCISHCCLFQDGNTKVAFYNTPRIMSGGSDFYQLMLTF